MDAAAVRDALPLLLTRATAVPLDGLPLDELRRRQAFMLRQVAEQEASVSVEDMVCLLISSVGVDDLRASNPFITQTEAQELLDLAVSAIMHANRVGQINRCVSEARGLLTLLNRPAVCSSGAESPAAGPVNGFRHSSGAESSAAVEKARQEAISALTLKSQTLAEQLLAKRHYVAESAAAADGSGPSLSYDPRFLLFEFTHNIVLREPQVGSNRSSPPPPPPPPPSLSRPDVRPSRCR